MKIDRTTALALTQTQAALAEHYRSGQNEPWCYHTQFSYHLHIQQLTLPLFYKALQGVLQRHPVIRTVLFQADDGRLQQAVQPGLKVPIQFDDISAQPLAAQAAWLQQLLLQDRNRPFLYAPDAPLCRAYLVRRSSDSVQLVLVFHHAIWDGWSLAVLLRELFAYYEVLQTQPTASLPPAEYDYREFVEAERRGQNARAAWQHHLEPHQPYFPPQEQPNVAYDHYVPVEVELSAELMDRVLAVQRYRRVTLKAIFLGLFVRLLQQETGGSHSTVGVVTNGRGVELTNPLTTLGLLWHLAPLCVENLRDMGAQIQLVNQRLAEIARYGICPMQELQREMRLPGLFHAAFNFINFEGANLLPANSTIAFLEVGGLDKFHYPLHLLVGKNPFTKQMSLVLNYDARCYSQPQVHAMLNQYVKDLEALGLTVPQAEKPVHSWSSRS